MHKISVLVHRKDETSVGDWWSPPDRYFPLNISRTKLERIKRTQRIGLFSHKRVSLLAPGHRASWLERVLVALFDRGAYFDNRESDLKQKIASMARCEFFLTNSYPGVYKATLLCRRVICQPFKYGFYNYKHAPAYLLDDDLEAAMKRAVSYPDALEECRLTNIDFYRYLTEKYGDI